MEIKIPDASAAAEIDVNMHSPNGKSTDITTPDVGASLNTDTPNVDGNVDIPSADVNIEGGAEANLPPGNVKVKSSSPSFMDKLGGFLRFNGKKSDESKTNKRGKKRKRKTDMPDPEISAGASVSADLPSASVSHGDDTDFVVVDTPNMPKKEIDTGATLPEEGKVDAEAKGPKSPSFFRRIGMFFNIGSSGGYDIEGKKKKKRRKLSNGSKDQSDALKLGADISTSEVSVKRDDSFTIPEADLNAPTVSSGISAGGNADIEAKTTVEQNIKGEFTELLKWLITIFCQQKIKQKQMSTGHRFILKS